MAYISFKDISKTYQTGIAKKNAKKALQNLSLQVEENEVFGIVGANGAGKSTLIKILMGFVKPDNGEIYIAGQPADSCKSHELIGYLPETSCLYPKLSISQHLHFSASLGGISRSLAKQKIREILHKVDLFYAASLPIKNMSKGMVQRAALAYALMMEPEILILDEPMSGLDPLGRRLVLDMITDYHSKNKTILFCSHILSDVERISSRMGIMHNGKLVAVVSPDELSDYQAKAELPIGAPPLESYFLKTVQEHADDKDNNGHITT